jgi:cardiolipin synthase
VKTRWIGGNRFRLLENGEQFYPTVFEAIANAQHEVLLETFILQEDEVGLALRAALLDAAGRGARVEVTVDGWGSCDLSGEFLDSLTTAGVHVHVFEPDRRRFGMRLKMFRRLHRKLVVVDGGLAYIGGINYAADHLLDFGPRAKQDYAVEVRGPIVREIHAFALSALQATPRPRRRFGWWRAARHAAAAADNAERPATEGTAEALFATRDNNERRRDIERQYRLAFRAARQRIVVANAYFFPGYQLLRDLRRAARRGVAVRLIVQGEPDMPIAKIAARLLYDHLLQAGVRVFEYCERPLHAKVAVVDDEWATVGSSNLDPLSLALNLEANVVIRDRTFNQSLHERLALLIRDSCKEVPAAQAGRSIWWRATVGVIVFHFVHRFPHWAGALPEHRPKIDSVGSETVGDAATTQAAGAPPR